MTDAKSIAGKSLELRHDLVALPAEQSLVVELYFFKALQVAFRSSPVKLAD